MELKQQVDQVVDLMKTTKESWVATKPENTDLAIYLHFWRGLDLVAMVQCPLDRDQALQAAAMAAAGFNATTVAITFESWHSQLPESPITGKRWRHHEMQFVGENYPEAQERGWVSECLTTSIHARDGSFALVSLPFWIKDDSVIWRVDEQLEQYSTDDGKGGGAMFSMLQQVMERPTLDQTIEEESKTNPIARMMIGLIADQPERRAYHTDVATIRTLTEKGLATAVALTANVGSEREQWIEERTEELGLTPVDQWFDQ